jgi:hypothetical protein
MLKDSEHHDQLRYSIDIKSVFWFRDKQSVSEKPGLWIRIRIESAFNDFVDLDPRARSTKKEN